MRREVCVVAVLVAALCAAGPSQDSRQLRSADTFWISGRYGRSLHPPTELTAKNNRFFLSNRYGKRSTNQVLDRSKKRIVCDCMPGPGPRARDDKRSVFGVSA